LPQHSSCFNYIHKDAFLTFLTIFPNVCYICVTNYFLHRMFYLEIWFNCINFNCRMGALTFVPMEPAMRIVRVKVVEGLTVYVHSSDIVFHHVTTNVVAEMYGLTGTRTCSATAMHTRRTSTAWRRRLSVRCRMRNVARLRGEVCTSTCRIRQRFRSLPSPSNTLGIAYALMLY